MIYYKIKDAKTGEFSIGDGTSPRFNKTGKMFKIGALKQHIRAYIEFNLKYFGNYKALGLKKPEPRKWPDHWLIVPVTITEHQAERATAYLPKIIRELS